MLCEAFSEHIFNFLFVNKECSFENTIALLQKTARCVKKFEEVLNSKIAIKVQKNPSPKSLSDPEVN